MAYLSKNPAGKEKSAALAIYKTIVEFFPGSLYTDIRIIQGNTALSPPEQIPKAGQAPRH